MQPHENARPPYAPAPHGDPATSPQPSPAYLTAARSPEALDQLRRRGQRQIVFGVIWIVFGIGITIWSLNFGASFYVVYWGPVVWGVVSIALGAWKVAKSRRG